MRAVWWPLYFGRRRRSIIFVTQQSVNISFLLSLEVVVCAIKNEVDVREKTTQVLLFKIQVWKLFGCGKISTRGKTFRCVEKLPCGEPFWCVVKLRCLICVCAGAWGSENFDVMKLTSSKCVWSNIDVVKLRCGQTLMFCVRERERGNSERGKTSSICVWWNFDVVKVLTLCENF
jgi:hypothetical protein